MLPEQIELLRDKARLWREMSEQGSIEMRDYNLRCAVALETLRTLQPEPGRGG